MNLLLTFFNSVLTWTAVESKENSSPLILIDTFLNKND